VPGKEEGRNGIGESFTQVSVGQLHSCGLTQEGRVWCWGRVDN
jgi:alpha-tubulin suppressor-like RCC1 family protein